MELKKKNTSSTYTRIIVITFRGEEGRGKDKKRLPVHIRILFDDDRGTIFTEVSNEHTVYRLYNVLAKKKTSLFA